MCYQSVVEYAQLRTMQKLAVEVWRLDPALVNTDATLGGLAWVWGAGHARSASKWKARIWEEDGGAAAWGWIFEPSTSTLSATATRSEPATLIWQTHPSRPELLDPVLDWFEAETAGVERQTSARPALEDAIERLRHHGYERDSEAPWGLLNVRDLVEIEAPNLPDGYRLKTMREIADVPKWVAVHRASWAPSKMTEAKYRGAMGTPPFRDDLDFAVEAADGTLVASAIGWYDEENHVGEFEPVGTHPDYRRRGMARALMLFGLRRFRAAGAERVVVGCRGDDEYAIPKRLYESVGFRELSRELRFIKSGEKR